MCSPGNTRKPLRMDRQAEKWLRLVGWTSGPMYRWKGGISASDRQTGGQTHWWMDGQPENIMSLVPKGGGIKSLLMCCIHGNTGNFLTKLVFRYSQKAAIQPHIWHMPEVLWNIDLQLPKWCVLTGPYHIYKLKCRTRWPQWCDNPFDNPGSAKTSQEIWVPIQHEDVLPDMGICIKITWL